MALVLADSLFVCDRRGLEACAAIIETARADHVLIEEIAGKRLPDDRPLVIDADVTSIANVRLLRRALPPMAERGFRAFVVDNRNRLEMVHASVLGATDLLKRPLAIEDIAAQLNVRAVTGSGASDDDGRLAMASAAGALGELFFGLTGGEDYHPEVVEEASAGVVDAIGDIGLSRWLRAVRGHHKGTFQHCLIVTGVLTSFGRTTGMSHRDVTRLTTAGLLHDIGKAAIPVAILDKPGKLSEAELVQIRSHPGVGFRYLSESDDLPGDVLDAVHHHHELLDGSGYPDGLAGSAIADMTRIVTICDVYGALIEKRAYKPAMRAEAALGVLEEMVREGKLESPLVSALRSAVMT